MVPDGFAYAYGAHHMAQIQREHGELQVASVHAQLRTLGLEDQIERGQTPPPAAGDVLLRTHDMSNK